LPDGAAAPAPERPPAGELERRIVREGAGASAEMWEMDASDEILNRHRELLDSIDTSTVVGLRDRALISVMTFAFARIGAVVAMRVEDYFPKGKRWWVRLHEKGGKRHEMPAHHNLEACPTRSPLLQVRRRLQHLCSQPSRRRTGHGLAVSRFCNVDAKGDPQRSRARVRSAGAGP
jgi:hypothetical protein